MATTPVVFGIVSNGTTHDYSQYIKFDGVSWAREDIDDAKAGRTKDGVMHRGKVSTKRKLSYTLIAAPQSVLAALDDDLSPETVEVVYIDLHGSSTTKTFYCSKFEASLRSVDDEHPDGKWFGGKFSIIEV